VITNTKLKVGLIALTLWFPLTLGGLSSFYNASLGAALGPVELEWLLIPSLIILLALGFLSAAYYLLVKNSRRLVKGGFILLLIMPHTLLAGYAVYIATLIIAEPYFTTIVTKPIDLHLSLDEMNRPIFFFSEYHIKDGFDYDPYPKYILEYPEAILKLSNNEQNVTGVIAVEYSYKKVKRFWLTHIAELPVETNQIDGSLIPPSIEMVEGMR